MSLRSIVDGINSGQYSTASESLKKHLADSPQSPLYNALKSLLEFKLNNRPEAMLAARTSVQSPQFAGMGASVLIPILSSFLTPVLISYNEPELLNQAFELANRQEPTNKLLNDLWLESMVDVGFHRGIHKSLVAKMKNCDDSRSAQLQAGYIMTISHGHPDATKTEKMLYSQLANRLVSNCLPVKSAQECFAVAKVYELISVQKMTEFLLEIDHRKYIKELLELQLLLLEGLEKSEKWQELMNFSIDQLNQTDSFNYWQALNRACIHLEKSEDAIKFREAYKRSANTVLAAADLAHQLGQSKSPFLVELWKMMQNKRSAYEFLADEVSESPELLAALQKESSGPNQSIESKINLAKLELKATGRGDIASLVKMYISNFKVKGDYMLLTDALLMAAQLLVRSNEEFCVVSAIVLLEYALKNDPNHFQVRLWLVYLYRAVGAMSKVRDHFTALATRNVQLETLGYLVLTRAASLLTRAESSKLLLSTLTVLKSSSELGGYTASALNQGVYTQLKGLVEMNGLLTNSLNHAIVTLENVKSQRLQRGGTNIDGVVCLRDDCRNLVDNRDFGTLFDPLGINPWQELSQGHEWVRLNRDKELIYAAVLTDRPQTIDIDAFQSQIDTSRELTSVEKWSATQVAVLAQGTTKTTPLPPAPKTVSWQHLNYGYTLLETLKLIDGAAAKLRAPKNSEISGAVKELCRQATTDSLKFGQHASSKVKPWAESLGIKGAGSIIEALTRSQLDGFRDLEAATRST